jgi:hypothetical protein
MLKLSDEALGAIMLALQKCLMEQIDIVPMLKEFEFKINSAEQLVIMNPPILSFEEESDLPPGSNE